MSRKTKPSFRLGVMALGAAVGVIGLAAYVSSPGAHRSADQRAAVSRTADDSTARSKSDVEVVTPHSTGDHPTFSHKTQSVPEGVDANLFALNEMVKQIPAIKGGTFTAIKVSGGVATISLNSEFPSSFGSEDEKLILDGIANTLGQDKSIQKFVIEQGGKPIDSFGHADLSEPMAVQHIALPEKPATP